MADVVFNNLPVLGKKPLDYIYDKLTIPVNYKTDFYHVFESVSLQRPVAIRFDDYQLIAGEIDLFDNGNTAFIDDLAAIAGGVQYGQFYITADDTNLISGARVMRLLKQP